MDSRNLEHLIQIAQPRRFTLIAKTHATLKGEQQYWLMQTTNIIFGICNVQYSTSAHACILRFRTKCSNGLYATVSLSIARSLNDYLEKNKLKGKLHMPICNYLTTLFGHCGLVRAVTELNDPEKSNQAKIISRLSFSLHEERSPVLLVE